MIKTLLLLLHPAMGMVMMGMLVWILAQLQHETCSYRMLKRLSVTVALLGLAIWITAGYWYVVYYPAEKMDILHGAMPWAHTLFMETKEHLFLSVAILALYLPIVVFSEGSEGYLDLQGRKLVRTVAWSLLLLLLFIEGAGAIVAQGVKHGAGTVQKIERGAPHAAKL